jgi:hypothetical protein
MQKAKTSVTFPGLLAKHQSNSTDYVFLFFRVHRGLRNDTPLGAATVEHKSRTYHDVLTLNTATVAVVH